MRGLAIPSCAVVGQSTAPWLTKQINAGILNRQPRVLRRFEICVKGGLIKKKPHPTAKSRG